MFTWHQAEAPRVGILVERRYLAQAQPRGLVTELSLRGTDVRVLVADQLVAELGHRPVELSGLDLVVARGRSARLLALLRLLGAHGVPLLHDAVAITSVVDKAGMAAVLARHRVPTPRTWLASLPELCATDALPFPLLLKPLYGDNARGIRVVRDRAALRRVTWPEPVALAQPFLRGDGHDVKLYVAGDRIWAVRRRSPIEVDGRPSAESAPGSEVAVTPEMRGLAKVCSAAFGLRLFGVDCLEWEGRLLVVEVNEYPNYRGLDCPADPVLGDVVLGALRGSDRAGVVLAGAAR